MTELSKNIKSDLQAQSDLLIKMNYITHDFWKSHSYVWRYAHAINFQVSNLCIQY